MLRIIAIAGNARSGKNKLGHYLKNILEERNIDCELTSFAHSLKDEVNSFLKEKLGISSFTEDEEEKNIIRPFLTFWGIDFRRKRDPDVWIKMLLPSLEGKKVWIITDLRFENELDWVISNSGIPIFLQRIDENNELIEPANIHEQMNNNILLTKIDYKFCWDTIDDSQKLMEEVQNFLNHILIDKQDFLFKMEREDTI